MSAAALDRLPGVVYKVHFAVGAKCRILSGGFDMMRWSNDYSLGTSGAIREWADQGRAESLHGRAFALELALTFSRRNLARWPLSTDYECAVK